MKNLFHVEALCVCVCVCVCVQPCHENSYNVGSEAISYGREQINTIVLENISCYVLLKITSYAQFNL